MSAIDDDFGSVCLSERRHGSTIPSNPSFLRRPCVPGFDRPPSPN